jgi:DNA polymerase III epsilon subunit family exonuclease
LESIPHCEFDLREHTIFAFDTETTGLDLLEDRIVQIGGVHVRRGIKVGQRRSSLVNPGVPIPAEASRVHGITDAAVATAPNFAEVGARFVLHLLSDDQGVPPILCGYNALAYDVPIINAELHRHGLEYRIDPTIVLDPLIFIRWHHRGLRSRKLESLARHYQVPLDNAHSAAADAEATALLLWRLHEAGLVPSNLRDALAEQHRLEEQLDDEWNRLGRALYLDRQDQRPRLGFGAHSGELLEETSQDYLRWCLAKMDDLTEEARRLIQHAAV